MKIDSINPLSKSYVSTKLLKTKPTKDNYCDKNYQTGFYLDKIDFVPLFKTVQFKGKTVHIVDGGIHATNMEHFAKFLKKDLNIIMHNVEINSKDRYTKQLKSLEEQLILLNNKKFGYDEYVAIPALASVPLLNIQDQYNRIIGGDENFTPENVKSKKEKLLKFLKEIYNYPEYYRQYINYMDPIGQGIEYTYGIIKQINNLIEKGLKVYVPSGHPADSTLKWMAGERGLKPELYHYIATGEDINSSVKSMSDEIKRNNWYSFNLLSLSEANVVGVKDKSWGKDYIFAAYDSCITDGARGTYNLSPLRNGNKVIGYSFSEEGANDYPYNEFPMNKEVKNLLWFVGKNKEDVVASKTKTKKFLNDLTYKLKSFEHSSLLYPIEEVFTEEKIIKDKLRLQGKYVDSSLSLFFDENKDGKIIFKKCDCEGSGRPSILSVWGSCYAVFNAIARDINSKSEYFSETFFIDPMAQAKYYKKFDREKYEEYLFIAAKAEKELDLRGSTRSDRYEPYLELAEVYENRLDYDNALGCLNRAMYIVSSLFSKSNYNSLTDLKSAYDKFINSENATNRYNKEMEEYNDLFFLSKLITDKPEKPWNYYSYKYKLNDKFAYEHYMPLFLMIYKNIARICELKGEYYPARVCKAALKDIEQGTERGSEIIRRQANKIQYIGDLYNEIKQY